MELILDKVTRNYKKKIAVNQFSATLRNGVYGLLGANGCGKTTLMRMLADVLKPTAGDITWNGVSIYTLGESYRNILGYLPQSFGVYDSFTATDFLMYLAAAKGLDRHAAKQKTEETLALVGLADVKKKKVKTFSGGMKQRLGIAQTLLNDPSVLLLDEPTAGLDPKERIRFRNLISEISANRIVLLSTHIVSDVESIAAQILMMKDGKLLKSGTSEEISSLAAGKVWAVTSQLAEAERLKENFIISNIKNHGESIELRIISDEKPSKDAAVAGPSLEEAYLYCFGEGKIEWDR